MSGMMSIYVHIPFCVQKCGYCDFLSFPVGQYGDQKKDVGRGGCEKCVPEEYLQRLLEEIRRESGSYADRQVDTVFIGGGTPSLLTAGQAMALMERIYRSFRVVPDAEITMEANPGTLTKEKLRGYLEAGVNRLSIGLQSVDDGELATLGRIHRFLDFQQNYELARDCGFRNINIDLMSGLPDQSVESWLHALHTVAGFAPEHISAYGLMIEEGTPFYQRYGAVREGYETAGDGRNSIVDSKSCATVKGLNVINALQSGMAVERQNGFNSLQSSMEIERRNADTGVRKEKRLPSEEEERQMYHKTKEILEQYGYRQYEISNYAKPGYECKHNIGYWTRKEYAGFGLGASSMFCNKRWKNTSEWKEYMEYTDRKEEAITGNEGRETQLKREVSVLSVQEQMEETMFLGLRMNRGVSKAEFEKLYGADMEDLYGACLHKMTAEGLLHDGDRVSLTDRGRDLANYVMAGFLLD